MSIRPNPTWVLHFTHIDHLPTIIEHGLMADSLTNPGQVTREAGNPSIKEKRRLRRVDIDPGGAVADYVPFYFAPRSPMMSAISNGRVPEFEGKVEDLVYLATTTQILRDLGLTVLCTDRNATLGVAEFRAEADSDDLVDWDLMKEDWWNNTADEPDRRERRMAECLVHRSVPFAAFRYVATHGERQRASVVNALARVESAVTVAVRPRWYI